MLQSEHSKEGSGQERGISSDEERYREQNRVETASSATKWRFREELEARKYWYQVEKNKIKLIRHNLTKQAKRSRLGSCERNSTKRTMSMEIGDGRPVLVIAVCLSGCSTYTRGGFHISKKRIGITDHSSSSPVGLYDVSASIATVLSEKCPRITIF